MKKPLGSTASLGAFPIARRTRTRSAYRQALWFKLALLIALLASPTLPCSMVSSNIGPPILGADGEVHWRAPNPVFTGSSDKFVHWITLGQDAPSMSQIKIPKITEGQASLVGQLADGRTWWHITCSREDPPRTSACASWVLVDANGEPRGRLPYLETYTSHLPKLLADGTLLMTELGRSGEDMVLMVRRGTPVPMERFDEPAVLYSEEQEPPPPSARRALVAWRTVWQARFPARVRSGYQRKTWVLRDDTFAIVTTDQKQVYVDAYQLRGDGQHRQLDVLYARTFPRANSGLPTNKDGTLALAPPHAVSLSSAGELAMGQWAINSDCSTDRPRGFVILGPRGNVIAEVRSSSETGPIDGLVFDARDQLVIASNDIKVYDSGGGLLRKSPRLPTLWSEQRNALMQRIQRLNVNSPLEDWALLYGVLDRYVSWEDPDPAQDTLEIVRRRLIEDWPTIDGFLPDVTWIKFAQDLCAEHPLSAPAAGLARFQGAKGWEKAEWLQVLPRCFPHPPASVQTFLDTMLASRDSSRRRKAQKILNAWTPNEEHLSELWGQQEIARSSAGSRISYQIKELQKELLQLLPANRQAFEERAAESPEAYFVASRVLLSSLGSWPVGYFPQEWPEARTAAFTTPRWSHLGGHPGPKNARPSNTSP